MTGRQVSRVAETHAGSKLSAGRHRPERLGNLIASPRDVVPRSLPHANPICERGRDMKVISKVEARCQQERADQSHSCGSARNSIHSQKHDGQHQSRAEVSLPEEQRQRRTHADDDGNGVSGAWKVEPCGHVYAADSIAAYRPQQLPMLREVTGKEERQQDPNRFNGLKWSEIDLRTTAGGAGSKR